MKNMLMLSLSSLGLFFASCNSKDVLKKQFVDQCIETGAGEVKAQGIEKEYNDYCNCAGEKFMEKFSVTEIAKMNKDEAEMQKKLMPVIQPCIDDLQKKVMEKAASAHQ